MNGETQVCRYCGETISRKAKLCPRCRQWLTIFSARNPTFSFLFFVIPVLVIFCTLGTLGVHALGRMFHPGPDFAPHAGSVKITQSTLRWAETDGKPHIYLVGTMTNSSPLAWRNMELECRFYDTNGVMIDAAHPTSYVTVQPSEDVAFRVSVTPLAPTNDYSSYQLRVMTAYSRETLF